MNPVTIIIGAAALLYGCYTAYLRIKDPSKFSKLEAMKKFWGERAGMVVHIIGYTVVPICAGIYFIYLGFKGIAIFG